MTVTITLPDDLAAHLRLRAAAQHRPAEDLALDLLRAALLAEPAPPALEEVVAQIRAAVPNPTGLRVARSGLANALAEEGGADFDVTAWQAAWLAAEAELAAIEHADDQAEGRRERR